MVSLKLSSSLAGLGIRKPRLLMVRRNLLKRTDEAVRRRPSKARLPTYSEATALL